MSVLGDPIDLCSIAGSPGARNLAYALKRENPASATLACPPGPSIVTAAAATSLRWRSSNSGRTTLKYAARDSLVISTNECTSRV